MSHIYEITFIGYARSKNIEKIFHKYSKDNQKLALFGDAKKNPIYIKDKQKEAWLDKAKDNIHTLIRTKH